MRQIHKGWIILFLLFCTMLGSLGFGRFSLGAILPFMREGLGLDYRHIGLIASAAFLGYLVSVSIVGYFVIRFGAKKIINYSMIILAIAMVICANAHSFWVAYFGCLLLGIGSGGSSIPAMGLAGRWFSNNKKGMAIGTAMGGLGLGIVISGLVVPSIVNITDEGWRISWYILSLVTVIFIIINAIYLKNSPEELGIQAIGEEKSKSDKNSHDASSPPRQNDKWQVYKSKQIWIIGFIYMSWGFSYLIFSTFLVDYLMKDLDFSKGIAGLFFSIAGLASIISGFVWGGVSDRFGRMFALSFVLIIQFSMLVALILSTSTLFIVLEVIFYGLTLWGVPTIMNASVADFVESSQVPVAMGFITIFFSIGQIISPVITGVVIEMTNDYFVAFLLSAFICLCGALGCMKLHLDYQTKQTNTIKDSRLKA
ncbi:MFS transporter [Alkalihalobacillus sp. BA299]|uniref:MFS transporter n=1 Tax=Alkalihalobacillus sp. BA299 TaxID=2815938 RepID=UPI001FFE255A|nr:MFS transporter [Alkalihalobacillus sp. BA299]